MDELKDELKVIAHLYSDFPEKFGVPRQSGLVDDTIGTIVFEPEYRSPDALKGLEGFSHIWLLWRFDIRKSENFKATVRPPRLGGNETMGVFATRSPFRPNPIGLSSVKLLGIEDSDEGKVLIVSGADLRNFTAIYDIKPYIRYTDSHPDAECGFADEPPEETLSVNISDEISDLIRPGKKDTLLRILSLDPRPRYIEDPLREYGLSFAGMNIKFTVEDKVLTVTEITLRDDYEEI
jgi:tRNA-Thr(GGU) m(6)t(6)A37 methyltransferase TsaA